MGPPVSGQTSIFALISVVQSSYVFSLYKFANKLHTILQSSMNSKRRPCRFFANLAAGGNTGNKTDLNGEGGGFYKIKGIVIVIFSITGHVRFTTVP